MHVDDNIDLMLWGNAESSITIIAASIPILRVLIRDVRTTMRSNRSGNGTSGAKSSQKDSRSGLRSTVTITGARRGPRVPDKDGNFVRMDDESDKSILSPVSGITKTDEYAVEYHHRKDYESDGKSDGKSDSRRDPERGYELQPV